MRTLLLLGERYRLGPVVGTGGMGTVHRAWDERFDREVAVKVVRAGADAVEQERLRREAQFLARLDHPNLVAVYDAGADAGRHGETVWFAMELVHGPDLRRVITERGRLGTADVARVLEGAVGALRVLHDAGVVHRDLKPANVLLTADPAAGRWDVKLADLGIAQLMRAEQLLTATGQVVGTAAYLSPEQVSGGRVGPASDIYSLGLLAMEALTGRVPFPGGVAESAAARLVRSPALPAGAGPEWRALLAEMTARDPRDRPDAEELLRRIAPLPRSVEPLPDEAGTVVLPASVLRPGTPVEDLATEAMELGATRPVARLMPTGPVTGWRPALRPRRDPVRRRRAMLGAAAVAVAVGLAGGGAALVAGGSDQDPAAAQARVVASTPAQPSHPASTPTPTATPKATSRPTPTPAAHRTSSAATVAPAASVLGGEDAQRGGDAQRQHRSRQQLRQQAHHELQRVRQQLGERLRERLDGR